MPFFSNIVSVCLKFALQIFYPNTFLLPNLLKDQGPILSAGGFTAQIGAPCSGIDSFLMFTALYIVIFALDRNKLKTGIYWLLFPIGLIGIFLFNILRLFLLYLVGIHISAKFAEGLFHQNIGWIIFIAYFILFWAISNRFIYKKA
jgi:exosortase/archaeosortase family protein